MTNTNNTPATAINFRAPFKVHVPINLTYNASASEEKVTAADLQRYIAEQTAGQCDYFNPRNPDAPTPIKPARKSDCKRTDVPIRDRDVDHKVRNTPTDKDPRAGVAEMTIDDLAESLTKQVNLYFDNLHKKIKEMEKELDNRVDKKAPLNKSFKELIEIEKEYLEARVKYLESKIKYGF